MHPVPPDPAALPDPTDLLRSRSYVVVLLFAALIGVPVAALAYLYLAVVTKGEHWLYASLPSDLGFAGAPVWWPLPLLALAGLLVAAGAVVAAVALEGHGPRPVANPLGDDDRTPLAGPHGAGMDGPPGR